jgi:hypothetical protein
MAAVLLMSESVVVKANASGVKDQSDALEDRSVTAAMQALPPGCVPERTDIGLTPRAYKAFVTLQVRDPSTEPPHPPRKGSPQGVRKMGFVKNEGSAGCASPSSRGLWGSSPSALLTLERGYLGRTIVATGKWLSTGHLDQQNVDPLPTGYPPPPKLPRWWLDIAGNAAAAAAGHGQLAAVGGAEDPRG